MKDQELEVLEQYDVKINSTRKIRGAILCDTEQGLFVLKELVFSEKRLPELFALHEHLWEQGYKYTDQILKTKEEQLFCVSEEGTKYLLKRWFCGKECESKYEMDVMDGVKNLAVLHYAMREVNLESDWQKETLEQEYFRHNRQLKKVRGFIRNKVSKGEFEHVFLKHFDEMYDWATCAKDCLQKLNYSLLLEESRQAGMIVHGEYNYHNIIMTPSGVATTNFEHFYQGIQVSDFYYFLRKTMEKNQWNIELGHRMLEQYNRILPFSREQLSFIAVQLIYPEKFWKVANSYDCSSKSWISAKSVEKLELSIHQMEEKKEFIDTLFPGVLS